MSASLPPPDRPLPPCVPFLPRDNDAADPDAAAVTTLLDQRLATLLRAPADAFWRHVAHDASLRRAIDTYLQFRRRPHDADDDADSPAASSSDDALRRSASLAKRVFNTYRRLATPSEPGSPFRGPDDHARALRASALAEPPCVLDVCAIFGRDNPRETAELVKTLHAILDLASPFAAAAKSAAEGLERTADELLHAAFENDTPGVPAAKRDDALRYFHDVAATVHAVARASPELAAAMTEGDERASTDDTKGKAPATSSSDRRASNASASALADAMDRVANETVPTLAANAPANVARAAETVSAALAAARETLLRGANEGTAKKRSDPDDRSARLERNDAEALATLRGIFPDRSEAFLARALARFGGDAELAAGRLLEGDFVDEPEEGPETSDETSKKSDGGGGGGSNRSRAFAPPPPLPSSGLGPAARSSAKKAGSRRRRRCGGARRVPPRRGGARGRAGRRARDSGCRIRRRCDDSYDELAEVRGVAESKPAGDERERARTRRRSGDGRSVRGGRGSAGAGGGFGGQRAAAAAAAAAASSAGRRRDAAAVGEYQYVLDLGRAGVPPRPGAREVTAPSVEATAAMAERMAARADAVHGLGAGGSRAAFAPAPRPSSEEEGAGKRRRGLGWLGRGERRRRPGSGSGSGSPGSPGSPGSGSGSGSRAAEPAGVRGAARDSRAQERAQGHHREPRPEEPGEEEDGPRRAAAADVREGAGDRGLGGDRGSRGPGGERVGGGRDGRGAATGLAGGAGGSSVRNERCASCYIRLVGVVGGGFP